MKNLAELIAEHVLFHDLVPEHLELLAGCAENVGFPGGAQIFREGEPANTFYVLRRGHVALAMAEPGHGQVVIETLGAGDVLGWSWLVPPYRWHFDAEAIEPTAAIMFDAACMRGKFSSDNGLGYQLMSRFLPIIVDRLQATRLRLLDLYGDVATDA
jgi:CRP/FNR family cyclic AMP-dependent transcriptional regulator